MQDYIGRRGIVFIKNDDGYPPTDSYWANPFKVKEGKLTRDEVVEAYGKHIQRWLGQIRKNIRLLV